MERFEADTVVIGAGVVGLAIARKLAMSGRDVIVLEAADAIATETSSRNSEVVHAGLYYRTGSLKAKLCVEGRRALYQYLDERHLPYNRCGKLVVGSRDGDRERLEALLDQSNQNDVEGVRLLPTSEALSLEPELAPDIRTALISEESGIFDSHAYFLALQGELEDAGGMIALNAPVLSGEVLPDGVSLQVGGDMPSEIKARLVVNAAGHNASPIARNIAGAHASRAPKMWFVRGSYFAISGKIPFQRLIYPVHNSASLGLHYMVDLGGQAKLGPDAEWLPEGSKPPFDYEVDPKRLDHFLDEVRRYWPGVHSDRLRPDYSGVRPKIVGPGEPSGDFKIEGPATHGSAGLVNLFGMESPGLTSSLAIADHVSQIIDTECKN